MAKQNCSNQHKSPILSYKSNNVYSYHKETTSRNILLKVNYQYYFHLTEKLNCHNKYLSLLFNRICSLQDINW